MIYNNMKKVDYPKEEINLDSILLIGGGVLCLFLIPIIYWVYSLEDTLGLLTSRRYQILFFGSLIGLGCGGMSLLIGSVLAYKRKTSDIQKILNMIGEED